MEKVKPKILKKDGRQRLGKGFSRSELKKARLSLKDALRFHIPVDSRRKSAHEENVNAIKSFLETLKKEVKPKRKSKK